MFLLDSLFRLQMIHLSAPERLLGEFEVRLPYHPNLKKLEAGLLSSPQFFLATHSR